MKTHITRHGHKILSEDTNLCRCIEQTGLIDYGWNFERKFRKFISEGDFVVDAGAFVGDHTVPFARIVGPKGKVYAFEPGWGLYECLHHNTEAYPWVLTVGAPLSSTEGREVIWTANHEDGNYGGSYILPPGVDRDSRDFWGQCHTTTLDTFLSRNLPEGQKVSFIKIDVEGGEIPVLEGSLDTLHRHRPFLFVEVLDANQRRYGRSSQQLVDWLHENLPDYTFSPEYHRDDMLNYDVHCFPNEKIQQVLGRAFE